MQPVARQGALNDTMTWYKDWFESPYWSILYKNRNEEEANAFLDRLTAYLELPQGAQIVDAGCGKGRHSHYLAAHGFQVTGLDYSRHNIQEAQKLSATSAKFIRHNLMEPFPVNNQDCVLNLFTSFGYYQDRDANRLMIENMADALAAGGRLVIDYLNAEQVRKQDMSPHIIDRGDGIKFRVSKEIKNNTVFKYIRVTDKDKFEGEYTEQVELYELADFVAMAKSAALSLDASFGSYRLTPLQSPGADRLIMIFSKP